MYLTELLLENCGPLRHCAIKLPFASDGKPLPLLLVGTNGSGKTIVLSYIVDAMFEFAKLTFRDIAPEHGQGRPYFRMVGPSAVSTGQQFNIALLKFMDKSAELGYCQKVGTLDPQQYKPEIKEGLEKLWNWPPQGNHKQVTADKSVVEQAFSRGTLVFFPSNRQEAPDWLNPASLHVQMEPGSQGKTVGKLDKPLVVESCALENTRWILDVFLDSQVDLAKLSEIAEKERQDGAVVQEEKDGIANDLRNRQLLMRARMNVEAVLREILGDPEASLVLNLRQATQSRISIRLKDGRIIPSLASLSTGQSILFHLFTTIVRYADRGDINLSFKLHEISGIVVIDEIDAHLHGTLQHDVVPRLMRRFPRVQFIVSTHAPLFCLGMEKQFGSHGFSIVDLPACTRIGTERFSEFEHSLQCYQQTKRFEEIIGKRASAQHRAIILTEGVLDPKYLLAAFELLGRPDLLERVDVQFVGIEDSQGSRHGGASGLTQFRNVCEANPSLLRAPTLLLYDCDTNKPPEALGLLKVRSIPPNKDDVKARKGIENLLPSRLFESRFYRSRTKEGDYGEQTVVQEFDKVAFCNWICKERRDAADFERFKSVIAVVDQFLAEAGESAP